jgi:hypothetical protein
MLAAFSSILRIHVYHSTLTQKLQNESRHTNALGADILEALYDLGTRATTVLVRGHALWCVNTCLNF